MDFCEECGRILEESEYQICGGCQSVHASNDEEPLNFHNGEFEEYVGEEDE